MDKIEQIQKLRENLIQSHHEINIRMKRGETINELRELNELIYNLVDQIQELEKGLTPDERNKTWVTDI